MPQAANPSNNSRCRFRLRAALGACSALAGAALLSTETASATPSAAVALPEDAASSQAWAKAYARGQWSVTIELLESIPESSRTAWHWLHLARALERRSRLVEAFAAYERVHDLAADGAAVVGEPVVAERVVAERVVGRRAVERQAKLESRALSNRIPWAEVALAGALPLGALVIIDQQWLEPTRLRSPYPVNPGWHTFLVESNGEVLAARRAFFEEGQTRLVPLTTLDTNVSMAVALPARGAASSAEAAHPRTLAWRTEAPQRPEADHDSGSLLKASYVSFGVGALGTLVGTGFLLSSFNVRSSMAAHTNCVTYRCDADTIAEANRADRSWRAQSNAATASYGIGLAGLLTGGVLWLLHRDSESRATTVHIADLALELAPRFSPHGAMLRGTF